MATATAIAIRRAAALERLQAGLNALAAKSGAGGIAPFVPSKHADLRETELIEWAANAVASIGGDAPMVEEAEAQGVELGAEVTKDGTPVVVTEAIDGKTARKPATRKKA